MFLSRVGTLEALDEDAVGGVIPAHIHEVLGACGDEVLVAQGVDYGGGGGDPPCVFLVGEGLEVSDGLVEFAAAPAPLHRLCDGDGFGPPGLIGGGARWLDGGSVLAEEPLVTLFVVFWLADRRAARGLATRGGSRLRSRTS